MIREINGLKFKILSKEDSMKYELLTNYRIQTNIYPEHKVRTKHITLFKNGILSIRRRFKWNGGDMVIDTDTVIRGSLVHDALCILYHLKLLAKKWIKRINDIYRDVCRKDGMSLVRYCLHRLGLRIFWWRRRKIDN